MKLLTYDAGSGPRCGVLQDDRVVDVTALIGADHTLRDVQALLESDTAAVQRVGDALSGSRGAPSVGLSDVRLRSPLLRPPTIRDFMIFEEHATQQGTTGAGRGVVPDADLLLLQPAVRVRAR